MEQLISALKSYKKMGVKLAADDTDEGVELFKTIGNMLLWLLSLSDIEIDADTQKDINLKDILFDINDCNAAADQYCDMMVNYNRLMLNNILIADVKEIGITARDHKSKPFLEIVS